MIPHYHFPAVDMTALIAELAREAGQRERFYPDRVAKGRMLQADADHEICLAHAWLEDARRIRLCWFEQAGSPPTPAAHKLTWWDRREGLVRELDKREHFYPEWITKGRLTDADARHRTACLQCLLAIYEDGWDFVGHNGARPMDRTWPDRRTPAEKEATIEFWQVQLESAKRGNIRGRRELALRYLAELGASPDPDTQAELSLG